MLRTLALSLVLQTPPGWTRVDTVDGIDIASRPVKDSKVVELKLTATVAATPERLCDEAFGKGRFDPEEPDLKSRKVLEESADARVTYDQISPPLVSNRDYAVRATRSRLDGGACQMTFEAANDRAPALPSGYVRIEKLKGLWLFEPAGEGKTKLTHLVHSDPAGAIPPFLVEGSRRKFAVRWVKMIVKRAAAPRP